MREISNINNTLKHLLLEKTGKRLGKKNVLLNY